MRTRFYNLALMFGMVTLLSLPALFVGPRAAKRFATLTFSTSNTAVVWGGSFTDTTVGGRNARQMTSAQQEFRLDVTGNQLDLGYYSTTSTSLLDVWIDGTLQTRPTLVAATWSILSLNLVTDALHHIVIKNNGTASAQTVYIDRTTNQMGTVTGAAPAVSIPSGFSQNIYQCSTNSTVIRHDGGASNQGIGGNTSFQGLEISVRWRVLSGTTSCKAYVDLGSGNSDPSSTSERLIWWIDGVEQSGSLTLTSTANGYTNVNSTASPGWGWVTLSGLDGAAHEITLNTGSKNSTSPGTGQSGIFQIMTVGNTLDVTTFAVKDMACVFGDSIAAGWAGTDNNRFGAFLHRFVVSHNLAKRNEGIGGTTCRQFPGGASSYDANSAQVRATSTILPLSPAPKWVIIVTGYNDAAQVAGAETAAQFRSGYDAMLTALNGMTGTKFLCVTIPPVDSSAAGFSRRSSFNTEIIGSVAAMGNTDKFRIVDTDLATTFNAASGADTKDGIHPNNSGYGKLMVPLEAAYNGSTAKARRRPGSPRTGTRALPPALSH